MQTRPSLAIFRLTIFAFLSLVANNQAFGFYIGPQYQHEKYKEILKKPLKSNEKGSLIGFKGGFEYLKRPLYAEFHVEYGSGKTHFDGTRYNLITKKTRECKALTNNHLINIETSLGCPFSIKNLSFIPFWGVGANRWDRELEDYLESYRWFYFPFGATSELCFFSTWKIGLRAKAMPTAFADVEVRGIYPWTLKLGLENTWQYSLDLYTKIKIKKVGLWLGTFYRNQNMGQSNKIKKSSFSSPPSKKTIFGGELLLETSF